MSAQSTSTASFLLASSRLPRFQSQSLRAPTKPPYRSASPYCLWFRGVASPTLLASMSDSALPPRVTAAPPRGLEVEDESGRLVAARTVAVARMCSALVAAWCQRALAVRAAAEGADAGASGAVEAAVGVGWAALRGSWPTVL